MFSLVVRVSFSDRCSYLYTPQQKLRVLRAEPPHAEWHQAPGVTVVQRQSYFFIAHGEEKKTDIY